MTEPTSGNVSELSMLRLHVLRAAYVVIALGLALMIWPLLVAAPLDLPHGTGVMWAMLGGVSLLALIGIRYPVRMIPLLLFELVWKTIWIVAIGLPLRSAGALTEATASTMFDTVFGVVFALVAIPWPYVWRHYIRQPGEPWRRARVPVPETRR